LAIKAIVVELIANPIIIPATFVEAVELIW